MPATAFIVLVADFLTKWLAIQHLKPRGEWYRYDIIPNYLAFTWRENTGGAFSILHDRPWIITGFSAIAIVAIAIYSFRLPRNFWSSQFAFGLILGGAVGNLIDRIRFRYVVDFIHAYFIRNGKEHFWPTFNIADAAIVVGIGIFLYLSMFTDKLEPVKAPPESPAPADEAAS